MAATIGSMPLATEQMGASAPAAAPAARKFKASDLPLPSATRLAIEGLAHSFKKKGGFDAIRKQVWEKFNASVSTYPFLGTLSVSPPCRLHRHHLQMSSVQSSHEITSTGLRSADHQGHPRSRRAGTGA